MKVCWCPTVNPAEFVAEPKAADGEGDLLFVGDLSVGWTDTTILELRSAELSAELTYSNSPLGSYQRGLEPALWHVLRISSSFAGPFGASST